MSLVKFKWTFRKNTKCKICKLNHAEYWIGKERLWTYKDQSRILHDYTIIICDKEECWEYLKLLHC